MDEAKKGVAEVETAAAASALLVATSSDSLGRAASEGGREGGSEEALVCLSDCLESGRVAASI